MNERMDLPGMTMYIFWIFLWHITREPEIASEETIGVTKVGRIWTIGLVDEREPTRRCVRPRIHKNKLPSSEKEQCAKTTHNTHTQKRIVSRSSQANTDFPRLFPFPMKAHFIITPIHGRKT